MFGRGGPELSRAADEEPRSAAQSLALVEHRAALLRTWALSPDPGLRSAIECELYGAPDAVRAEEEAERLADLG